MNAKDITKKYKLGQDTWTNKGFQGVLHPFFPVAEVPTTTFRKYFGDSHSICLVFFHGDYGNWYWHDPDMERLRNLFIQRVNNDPKYLDRFLALWHKLLKKFVQTYKKCDIDLGKLSDDKLIALYKEFYKAYTEEYGIAIGVQDAFSMHADRFFVPLIKDILKKEGRENELGEIFAALTAPLTESFVTAEYRERLTILFEIQKDEHIFEAFKKGKEAALQHLKSCTWIDKRLEKHQKKWFWTQNNYAVQRVLAKDYFVEKIMNEIHVGTDPKNELQKIQRRVPETNARKKKLIRELGLDEYVKNLIRITEVFAYMQDERKKYVLISNHYQRLFFEEIGRRVGLTPQEMEFTVITEMENILMKRKIDRKKLALRRKHCLCIFTPKGYEIFEGDIVDHVFEVFEPKTQGADVQGTCASQGKAEGVVKIVRTVRDLALVGHGDILMASMTRPEMVVAMEKAAAIVTDEGGITSHAAVVSRELGIPCVVGTRNATQVFKTGDFVEVDATKGLVRKIRRK